MPIDAQAAILIAVRQQSMACSIMLTCITARRAGLRGQQMVRLLLDRLIEVVQRNPYVR